MIKKLIIEEHVDVDRFLITTFTKAASEEMRQRLEKAVRQELGKTGQDGASGTGSDRAFLLRQLQILPSAAIGTFHSFAIDIIRQYFYLTDLEPGFTILDEVQQSIMKRDAVDQVFARRYEESSPEFFAFLERHSSDRNDNALKDNLIKMYNSLRSIPFYMEWAKKKTELMKSQSPSKDMGLLEYIAAETATSLAKAGEYYDKAAELLNTPYSQDIFSKAAEDAANINNAVSRAADYDFMQSFFNTSLNSMRAKKAEQQAFDAVKEEEPLLEVETDIGITGSQQQGTFIVQDGVGHIVHAIVGIAQVIVQHHLRSHMLDQRLILLNGFLIILVYIVAVGFGLAQGES